MAILTQTGLSLWKLTVYDECFR